jgi:alanyl-tRNA synthetase
MKTATASSRSGTTCSCSSTCTRRQRHPLPAPCVDTGMGLERLAAILQHVHSNYEIDLFDSADQGRGARDRLHRPGQQPLAQGDCRPHPRHRVFLVSDGVIPGNEGRGYVQRRIIRRAIRHGYKLGRRRRSSTSWWPTWSRLMGEAYPRLAAQRAAHHRGAARPKRSVSSRRWPTAWRFWTRRWPACPAARRGGLQAARHLRLPARPVGRRVPRARRDGRRGRLRRRDGPAEGPGRAAGKFKMDKALEYTGDGNASSATNTCTEELHG